MPVHPISIPAKGQGSVCALTPPLQVDRLIVPSAKMVLLDKLLRRLKATGHRVLIFSQV